MDEGVQLLRTGADAQRLFANQGPREKRRQLNFKLSNCTWEDGEVVAFRHHFDVLAETAMSAAHAAVDETVKTAISEIWLPFLDTYRTMCLAPQPDFREILEHVRSMQLAA